MRLSLPLLIIFLFGFFTSCKKSPENEVLIISKNFSEEVQEKQNLSFVFNKDLVQTDQLGAWDSTPYITFEPAVAGKFRWTAANELVFSPLRGFEPSQEYKAIISDKIFRLSDNKKWHLGGEKKFSFHTPWLEPVRWETFWAAGKNANEVIIRAALEFNYPVNSKDLSDKLKVSGGGKDLTLQIEAADAPSKIIYINLSGAPESNEEMPVNMKLTKGLPLPGSSYKTTTDFELAQVLPSRFELRVLNVDHGYEGENGYIRIFTSQPINESTINNGIKIDPTIETKKEISENSLTLTGKFNVGGSYMLKMNKDLKGIFGGTMAGEFSKELFFGDMPPSIAFANSKAIYLSSAGEKSVAVRVINVPRFKIEVWKIYENNILSFMRNNRFSDYYWDEEENYVNNGYRYQLDYSNIYSDKVWEQEISTASLPGSGYLRQLRLDIPKTNDYRGVYLVRIASDNNYYLNDMRLISVSDIGIIAKQGKDHLMVMTNSIKNAGPIGNAEITLISANNQEITKIKTDRSGIAMLDNLQTALGGFKIGMIIARSGDDVNYLMYEGARVETSRFEVDGAYDNASGLQTFIYGQRNIYRPGETIYFNTILRENEWKPAANVPVQMKLVMPNGKVYQTLRANTSAQGAVAAEYKMAPGMVTGYYSFEVYSGNGLLLASEGVQVEEFMPDRLKVTVNAAKPGYFNGQTATVKGLALNLFGPPAANRNYEAVFSINAGQIENKQYRGYNFSVSGWKMDFEQDVRSGTTDDSGRIEEQYQIPAEWTHMGLLNAKAWITVFDETGRPVNRRSSFNIHTQKAYFGVKTADYYVSTNQPMSYRVVALDTGFKPANAKAEIQVIRHDWITVTRNDYGTYRYQSQRVEKLMSSRTVDVSKDTELTYMPAISGEYEIRIGHPGTKGYVSSYFYAYGYGNTEASSFEVNTDGEVEMVMDKESYSPGDNAKILFKTPFAGKLIVTIERNRVTETKIIETDKKAAELNLKITGAHVPNVYVSATLIRKLENDNLPLMVAHGYASLSVSEKSSKLPVEITIAEKSRSKTKQKIKVKAGSSSDVELTVAVVDEGILQLRNFKTPDPHGFFYRKKALEVNSYDVYPFVFPEIKFRSSTGGDGYDLEKRVNPLTNNRVKLVSFWSGILKTNNRGEAEYEIDIPQFSGSLRVMAVAWRNHSFGSAEKNIQVADPLVISTALPRFLSLNDELPLPVNITNTTDKSSNTTVKVSVSGPVEIVGSTLQTLTIGGNREGVPTFSLKAKPEMGIAKVSVSVQGLGENFTDETEITVRPASSLIKLSGSGVIEAGGRADLAMNHDFIPSTVASRIILSKSPMVQFARQFEYLLGYPHGCLEQTVSKAFPQIYFEELAKNMESWVPGTLRKGENERNPRYNVTEAIAKVQGLQSYSGTFSFWPGGSTYYDWTSAYATHFLIEAQKAGYDVNNEVLNRALEYLNGRVNNQNTINYGYYDENNNWKTKPMVSPDVPYGIYILALAGQPNRSAMNSLRGKTTYLNPQGLYLLACAYKLSGDGTNYKALLPQDLSSFKNRNSHYFESEMRVLGLVLNALLETDAGNSQIPVLSKNLSEMVKNSPYYSTHDIAFAFLSLGKIAKQAAKSDVSATVSGGGKTLGNFANNDLVLKNKGAGETVSIKTSGNGKLYYFWDVEGLSASGKVTEGDSYLRVRRTFYNRYGQIVNNNEFKQNDLIVVRLTLNSLMGTEINNIVVSDIIPASFEIENPRINETPGFEWIKNASYPEHFDIRDDRIHYFTRASTQERNFYYMVRVVSKGTFHMGPARADAMYQGEYHSYHGAGKVVAR